MKISAYKDPFTILSNPPVKQIAGYAADNFLVK